MSINAINLKNFLKTTSIDTKSAEKSFNIDTDDFAKYDTDGDGNLTVYEIMSNADLSAQFEELMEETENSENKQPVQIEQEVQTEQEK